MKAQKKIRGGHLARLTLKIQLGVNNETRTKEKKTQKQQ